MAFCWSDLCRWRAWDAYSIDIIIQHGKFGRDRESGKAAFMGFSPEGEIRKATPMRSYSGPLEMHFAYLM
jgi:hypothetical protein